jgi:hypothetical protein
MTCTTYPGVLTICRADDRFLRKEVRYCPMDMCKTEMAVRYEAYYGVTAMCCKCGDAWTDGELHERPFARGWRKQAVKEHRRVWDRASHGKPPTFEELFPEFTEDEQGAELVVELPSFDSEVAS